MSNKRIDLYDPYVVRKSAHPADVKRYVVMDMQKICPIYVCPGYGGAALYAQNLRDNARYMVMAYNGQRPNGVQ